jgi:hypothetical protein
MKLILAFTLLFVISTTCCFGQKKKQIAITQQDPLAFDTSGNFVGKRRWSEFTRTDILLLNTWFKNDTLKLERKLNLIGYVALQKDGTETELKIGRWQTVVPGLHTLRLSVGDYSIGTFEKCCEAGICKGYYNYKTGYWKFYYLNGQLKASGNFQVSLVEINTGCGNQTIKKSKLGSDWIFFTKEGQKIIPDGEAMQAIEGFDEFKIPQK